MQLVHRSLLVMFLCLCCGVSVAEAAEENTSEVTVTSRGMGTTADLAKRDALMNAVYQAVGSYVDSETLVKNDQLIKEQILQASGSYVHRYDVLSGPAQRDDSLWEISIRAVIRGGQVQERLKAVTFEQTGLGTKDQVAEALSKIKNAKEGAAILQSQLEGLLPKLLVARLINSQGKASDQIRPEVQIQEDGRLACTWYVEIYFDAKTFYEKVVPPLDQVLTAIASNSGGPMQSESTTPTGQGNHHKIYLTDYPVYGRRQWRSAEIALPQGDQPHVYFLLSTGRSETGGTEHFHWYLLEGVDYVKTLSAATPWWDVTLNVEFLAEDGGVVWKEQLSPWTKCLGKSNRVQRVFERGYGPYHLTPIASEKMKSNATLSPAFGALSSGGNKAPHYAAYDQKHGSPYCNSGHGDTILRSFTITVDPKDMERMKQVRFHFSNGSVLTP